MALTREHHLMLKDNGFSSPEELFVYRNYDPKRRGCNLEDRFVIRSGEDNAVHCEYEMLDPLMEMVHGPMGREWKLVRQELKSGLEPSQDGEWNALTMLMLLPSSFQVGLKRSITLT